MNGLEVLHLRDLTEKSRRPLRLYFERRVRGNADAEDMVQEVFVRMARIADAQPIENIEGYVCQIAANLVRDHARRRAVRKQDIELEVESVAEETAFSPERVLLGKDAVMQVITLLHELPQKTQTIFTLYHFEVIPQVQIARRLGVPLSTVEKHMCRANDHLQYRLRTAS